MRIKLFALLSLSAVLAFGQQKLSSSTANLSKHKTLQQSGAIQAQRASQTPSPKTNENASPFDAVRGLKEDTSKRDAFSKHYVNEDGSFTALIGAGPIHYQKNGQYLDIDHKITQSGVMNYPFANTTNLMESYFGATVSKGVKSKTAEGEVLEFMNPTMYWEVNGQAVQVMQAANSPAQIQDDKAVYPNVYGNIAVEYQVLTGKREMNYVIPNKQALGNIPNQADYLVFTEEVVLPMGWTSTVTEQGILIKNQMGQEMYLYENPHSTDAQSMGLREENTLFATQHIGNTLKIATKVKADWLLSNERVYPVMVDPTANYFVSQTDPSGYLTTGTVTSHGYFISSLNGDLASGFAQVDGAARNLNGFAKYDISSIPVGSTVSQAVSYTAVTSNSTPTSCGHAWASCTVDPATATASQIYNEGATLYWSANPYRNTGNLNQTLNASARTNIQNSLTQGWFAMLLYPIGNNWFNNAWMQVKGESGNTTTGGTAYRPYLSITYTASNCTGTPTGGTTSLSPNTGTHGQAFTGTVSGSTSGSGITYQ